MQLRGNINPMQLFWNTIQFWAMRLIINLLWFEGGFDYESNKDTAEVWRWTGDSWEAAGLMTRPRAFAATSTIPMDDPAMQFCV